MEDFLGQNCFVLIYNDSKNLCNASKAKHLLRVQETADLSGFRS